VQICTLPVGSGSLGIDSWGAPEIQKKRPQRLGGSAAEAALVCLASSPPDMRLNASRCHLFPTKKDPSVGGVARWGQ
jgi:hypothetical protein